MNKLDTPIFLPENHPLRAEGIVAIGGHPSPEVLLESYAKGIFPWYNEGDLPMWFSPDPRMVLFPAHWQPKKSLRQVLRKNKFTVTFDTQFEQVMRACGTVRRKDQEGTWIQEDLVASFVALHKRGIAHSVEVWFEGNLVGGLYGMALGKVFFGESMFHKMTDASKVGFAHLIAHLRKLEFEIIDCQIYTAHLASLGAVEISKTTFEELVLKNVSRSTEF